MERNSYNQVIIRFSTYELDLRAGELRKQGVRIKLQEQPFRILEMLLANPGQLVTREELRSRLWSSTSFVDFDHGLNKAMNKLREALGDSAESPRCIETLAKRGYRFICPVEAARLAVRPHNSEATVVNEAQAVAAISPVDATPWWQKIRWLLTSGIVALLVALGLLAILWPARQPAADTRTTRPAQEPSIAVLPFVDMSADKDQEYFADGMAEELISLLSRIPELRVPARTSSFYFKGKSEDIPTIARRLMVAHVLEGSVRKSGNHLRITVQLVRAHDGYHLWSETYDRALGDVFKVQDDIAAAVVRELKVSLLEGLNPRTAPTKSVEHVETRVPEAYDALLQGWAHYRMGSEEEIAKAIALFEQAIALDPEYGRAHAAVAAASWRIVQSFWESTTVGGYQRAFDRMQEALGKAMRQPNALAYAVSAEVMSKQGRYDEAFADIDRAMALAPNDPDIHLSKARILNATGRAAQAEESVRRAMRLDPLYSPDYLRTLAVSLFHQKRYEEAVETIHRVLALRTDVADDYITLIASLGQLGRSKGVPEAIKAFNDLSVSAGYNSITVQMFGGWWWYGDTFDYDTAYRDQLVDGLRKAGVPEGAGTDIPLEKVRRLLHKSEGFYNVDGATTVDANAAKTLHDRGVKFVDVRSAKGFDSGHVPGAFNLDVATELSRDSLSRIVDRNEEVVLSCHGKTCPDSAYASAKAVLWGFKHVYYFSGGFPAWKEAGYPVEASSANRPAAELPAKS